MHSGTLILPRSSLNEATDPNCVVSFHRSHYYKQSFPEVKLVSDLNLNEEI